MTIDDEMRAWLAGRVPDGRPEERLQRLLAELVDPEGLGLSYSDAATRTAREMFDRRQGNCLSFTHLFVGLAREMGLDAYYLEVRRERDFEQTGDLVIVWEHVTAGYGEPGRRLILEFDGAGRAPGRTTRELSDLTGVAMHYSNLGAERLQEGRLAEALEALEIAIQLDPGWSPAWLNLGVVRRRNGELDAAEAAYRRAIEVDPEEYQPYFNLAGLLRSRGDRDAAREMLALLEEQENRDPFVHMALGDDSLEDGQVGPARRFYRRAVRLAPDAAEPRAAMGYWALSRGRLRQARRALERAEERSGHGPRLERLRNALEPPVK